jgi:FixJ family two-component response regulator
MQQPVLISIVDDDVSVREALVSHLQAFGFEARTFGSAEDFMTSEAPSESQCLLLDISMPSMSGPQLYSELASHGPQIPTIFITADDDQKLRETLLRRGAVACLLKPINENELRSALERALSSI